MNSLKSVLVLGGNGALGRCMVNNFKQSWEVTSIDFSKSAFAHHNILLSPDSSPTQQAIACTSQLSGSFEAILCVAGGFVAGPVSDPGVFEQFQESMKVNFYPSLLAAHLATKFLAEAGLLLFAGAAAAFEGTTAPLMGYGLSKVAVHSLAQNMATREHLPRQSTVVTILPVTIDTPANREAMPDENQKKWTDPNKIAGLVKMWAESDNRPENGSFAVLKNAGGQVAPEFL